MTLYLPVQVVPVYPLTHAHFDVEQTVLASTPVHWEVIKHTMPMTAETDNGKHLRWVNNSRNLYNTLYI